MPGGVYPQRNQGPSGRRYAYVHDADVLLSYTVHPRSLWSLLVDQYYSGWMHRRTCKHHILNFCQKMQKKSVLNHFTKLTHGFADVPHLN